MEHLLEEVGASSNLPKKERVIEELLMDDVKADIAHLPNTGVSREWEHKLSSICVDTIGTMVLSSIALNWRQDLKMHNRSKCQI
jgi:uncharacterized protein with NRDE domain